jgi:hypothetical protein
MLGAITTTTVAWIAVVGAVGGALVGTCAGALVDYVLQRGRENRTARVGARLVRIDLAGAAGTLQFAVQEKKWHPFLGVTLPAWREYRAVLAGRLSDEEYKPVANAVLRLEQMEQQFERILKAAPVVEAENLSDEVIGNLRGLRNDIHQAFDALARLAGENAGLPAIPDQ